MKASVKAAWVKDLRSGEFEQGVKKLDYIDPEDGKRKFCCLGVLCRQAVKAGIIPEPELHYGGIYLYLDDRSEDVGGGEGFTQDALLPKKVEKWAGLDGDDVDLGGTPASTLNDLYGYPFADIADLVEAHVPADA